MSEHNYALISMMVIAIILLFASMVLSAMASSYATTDNCKTSEPHRYAMYSSLICGLSTLLIGVSLVIYLYRSPIVDSIAGHAKNM